MAPIKAWENGVMRLGLHPGFKLSTLNSASLDFCRQTLHYFVVSNAKGGPC
jgi:hypothetical protein